ncbi:flagellar motor protein MotB [Cryobacterium sp. PH31-L1]|uniref:OmpA/MotB family protein n=1 Tax=Cryobacterium sp. PH31-L1 TaxID=3046199 RepID=UPI0024B915F4|nr:flagellar motor protein MotB [Cryobacterium sp. PH31-L1]MDJ0378128.1 flagellar motor protein MotB [Cryobacterium sp. PH31-L1]
MSAPAKRRKMVEEEDVHPDERWMASYMDMVTVLMCMFIVLFAMSTVDQDKYEQLANSLATGFGAVDAGKVDTAEGVVVPADLIDNQGESPTEVTHSSQAIDPAEATAVATANAEAAQKEVAKLDQLEAAVTANLTAAGVAQLVEFHITDRGLTLGLVGSETFFAPDSAELTAAATAVLDAAAPAMVASGQKISVEGHADKHGQSATFASDWELSASRATQVLRRLVEQGGIGGEMISAVAFGSAQPANTGSTLEDMAQNRRVDVVLLSDQPDSVRALIPGVAGKE